MRVTRNNGTTEAKVEPAILAYSFPLAGSLHWIGQKRKAMSRKDREKKPHDAEQAEAEMRNAGAETPEGACNATDAPHAEGEATACDNVADDTEDGQPTPLEAALSEIEEWDSLSHVAFMALAATKAAGKVAPADVKGAQTVRDLYHLLTGGN